MMILPRTVSPGRRRAASLLTRTMARMLWLPAAAMGQSSAICPLSGSPPSVISSTAWPGLTRPASRLNTSSSTQSSLRSVISYNTSPAVLSPVCTRRSVISPAIGARTV